MTLRTIDCSAGLGSFPFRRVWRADAQGVLDLMGQCGISHALVSAFEGILYRNVQAANELLADRIGSLASDLSGVGFVNPRYAQADKDARICVEQLGMKALKLLPSIHGYPLSDTRAGDIAELAAGLGVPLFVMLRIEDPRQYHWALKTVPVDPGSLSAFILDHPKTRFVLQNISTMKELLPLREPLERARNWFIEIGGRGLIVPPYPQGLHTQLAWIGSDRVLFGSDMPLQHPAPAQLKVEALGLEEKDKARILFRNAEQLFNLPRGGSGMKKPLPRRGDGSMRGEA